MNVYLETSAVLRDLLDGLHLATIAKLSGALAPLFVVSTDERIRRNVAAMGLHALP